MGFDTVDGGVVFTYALRAGTPPCSLVFEGELLSKADPPWAITSVERISAEPGETCRQQVLFDVDTDGAGAALAGGALIPPGKAADPDVGLGVRFEDYNFDGYLDLAVMSTAGNFANAFRYWTYDPGAKRFVHQDKLAELGNLTLDANAKTLSSMLRGGNQYAVETYRWLDGELVLVGRTDTWLGTDPDGKSVSGRYERVQELRDGKMVVVREGVVND